MTTETDDKKYNGYTNYETWLYCLHVDNDEASQENMLALAAEANESEYPISELRSKLKEEIELAIEELDLASPLLADLLNASIENINWHEVCTKYIQEAKEREVSEHA